MALSAEELVALLEQAASRPKRVTGDAGTVIAHSLKDLIEMHQHLSASAVASPASGTGSGLNGIRVTKLTSPGTVT